MQISLRELERTDILQLNEWRNDPEIVNKLGSGFKYISKEIDLNWYEEYLEKRKTNIRLAIEVDNTYVGNVNLTNIDFINRSAEFSIFIGNKDYRGKGIGYKATSELINHGIINLGLNRIWLTVLAENNVAQGLYKKIGFEVEGNLRNAIFKNGKFHNLILMSFIKN
jgi:diamine N-acetyltransferase